MSTQDLTGHAQHPDPISQSRPDDACGGYDETKGLSSSIQSTDIRHRWLRPWVPGLCGAVAVLACVLTWTLISFNSLNDALLYLTGRRIIVEPTVIGVGNGIQGETRTVSFRIRNISGRDIDILGATASCACISAGEVPVKIHARGQKDFPIILPPQQNLWVRSGSGSLPRLCSRASFATLTVRKPYDFLVTSFTLLLSPSTAPDET
jgi:hypothetical protein